MVESPASARSASDPRAGGGRHLPERVGRPDPGGVDTRRVWLAIVGATILGFGVATLVHIAAQGNAGFNKGFPLVGVIAGFGLGLVLAAFLIRPRTTEELRGRTGNDLSEPWHDLLPPGSGSQDPVPEGWLPDPLHPHDAGRLRYWDGSAWTSAIRNRY